MLSQSHCSGHIKWPLRMTLLPTCVLTYAIPSLTESHTFGQRSKTVQKLLNVTSRFKNLLIGYQQFLRKMHFGHVRMKQRNYYVDNNPGPTIPDEITLIAALLFTAKPPR